MKIRNGFVSNSSVSSFIIRVRETLSIFTPPEIETATEEDIEKALDYGFIKTNYNSPFDFIQLYSDMTGDYSQKKDNDNCYNLAFRVGCNQDEVIEFLIDNNIPFKAACHYGHKFIKYDRDSDYIINAPNHGIEIDMYGERETDKVEQFKIPIEKKGKENES